MGMQYSEVKELIELFDKTGLNDMDLQMDNVHLHLNRSAAKPPCPPPHMGPMMPPQAQEMPQGFLSAPAKEAERETPTVNQPMAETVQTGEKVIKAPIVGTFYRSAAPTEEPFVKEGDSVSAGDVVCIIEAMKFMNEVNSDISGTVAEVLVEDGEFVEYGQELFRLR